MSAYYSTTESTSPTPEDDWSYSSVVDPFPIHNFVYVGELSQEFPASASGHWNTNHVGFVPQPRDDSRPQASAVTSVPFPGVACSGIFDSTINPLWGNAFHSITPLEYETLERSPQSLNEVGESPTLGDCIQSQQSRLGISFNIGQPMFFGSALQSEAVDHASEAAQQFISPPPRERGCKVTSHGLIQTQPGTSCQDCKLQFPTRAELDAHAKATQHAPYRCQCGTPFSRLDVLARHIKTFQPAIFYPCPHCKKHRGPRAFVRRDHLMQHLRGYHNIESADELDEDSSQKSSCKGPKTLKCPHETCLYSSENFPQRDEPLSYCLSRTFQTRGEFTKHLREVHDESLFPCTEIGCARVGGKGFFRKKDLLNHAKNHHPGSAFQSSAT